MSDFGDQVIKVLDYVLSSPLLIGIAIFFGAVFLIVFALVVWQFVSIGRAHKQSRERSRTRWGRL